MVCRFEKNNSLIFSLRSVWALTQTQTERPLRLFKAHINNRRIITGCQSRSTAHFNELGCNAADGTTACESISSQIHTSQVFWQCSASVSFTDLKIKTKDWKSSDILKQLFKLSWCLVLLFERTLWSFLTGFTHKTTVCTEVQQTFTLLFFSISNPALW